MKKIEVDQNTCIGCGMCISQDPKHFDYNDNGLSHCISQEDIESEDLKIAVEGCPVSAIKIVEDTDTENTL